MGKQMGKQDRYIDMYMFYLERYKEGDTGKLMIRREKNGMVVGAYDENTDIISFTYIQYSLAELASLKNLIQTHRFEMKERRK